MKRRAKATLVIGGYLAAIAAAVVAGGLYNARVASLPYDTSGGMYAAGEMLSGLGAFLLVALVPSALLLWFLRGHERFWNAVGNVSLGFAIIGLVAVLTPLVTRGRTDMLGLMVLSLVGILQLLGVPLWSLAFGLFALLAPTSRTRHQLVAALGIEVVIGVCAFAHWFVPRSPL